MCSTSKAHILVRQTQNAIHCWPNATGRRWYLGFDHMHRFLISIRAPVSHDDRQIEFHDLRDRLRNVIIRLAVPRGAVHDFGNRSCEAIGRAILGLIPEACWIQVMEDEEHGAEVDR